MGETQSLIIYNIIWALLFVWYYYRSKHFGIGGFLLLLYFSSGLTSIFFHQAYNQVAKVNFKVELGVLLYLQACVFICIYPFLKFSSSLSTISISEKYNHTSIQNFLKLSSPIILFLFLELLYGASQTDPAALAEVYDKYYNKSQEADGVYKLTWIGGKCKMFVDACSYIWPIFLFECLHSKTKLHNLAYIPLLAIACLILTSYVSASRTSVIKVIMYVFIVFYFYKNSINSIILKKIKRISIVSVIILILILILITISRYSVMDTDITIIDWSFLYTGEGVLRFCENIWDLNRNSNGDTCFSFFKELLGFDSFMDNDLRREYYEGYFNIPVHIFYTFIGDFYQDFGRYFTPIVCLLFSFISYHILRSVSRTQTISLIGILCLSLMIFIVAFGFMYYVFKVGITQLHLIINIIVLLFITKK